MVPTFLGVCLLAFLLLQQAPGDPVLRALGRADLESHNLGTGADDAYVRKRAEMGLNKPLFYVAVGSLAEPDTLWRVPLPQHREILLALLNECGDWPAVQTYWLALAEAERRFAATDSALAQRELVRALRQTPDWAQAERLLADAAAIHPTEWQAVQAALLQAQQAPRWRLYVPTMHWHGTRNQFHAWLSRLLMLDFGTSFADGRQVSAHLAETLPWSLLLGVISLLVTYGVSVPLGVWAARQRGRRREQLTNLLLLGLYSLPGFWVALLLVRWLANPENLLLFPASGVHSLQYEQFSPAGQWLDVAWHLVLPVVAGVYGSFAFLSRQVRSATTEALQLEAARTARAKGLPERAVVWRHGFRNALPPLVALTATLLPAVVGGSVVLETIFSIPGTGFLAYSSILAQDYPLVVGVMTLSTLLTLLGMFLADLALALADPRIRFSATA